ncbi:MAG: OpgC family protein [Hyphomicrobiales bacterium]
MEHTIKAPPQRDLRIDFFRGLALIMIFIDHIPGNTLSRLTFSNFGFSDAAEVFVFLAGYSAMLAYSRAFERRGFIDGSMRVGRRIFEIYYWHLGVLALSFALLVTAAQRFGDPAYLNNIGMWEFILTPGRALAQSLSLVHQPNLLNILPLYIALLAWFPVLYLLIRIDRWLALSVSFLIWLAANLWPINLPSTLEVTGWVFNPFAWQFLFAIGAVAADSLGVRQWRAPGWVIAAASAYLVFALVMNAPWTAIPGLGESRLISASLLGHMDKSYLSLWRVLHLLALACVIDHLVRPRTEWLQTPLAEAFAWPGRHSLEVFCFGTLLSFAGWIVLRQTGAGFGLQFAVTVAGIGAMVGAAWVLEKRKRERKLRASAGARQAPRPSLSSSRSSTAGQA